MTGLIKGRGPKDIRLVGSWYHIEQPDFPYYVVAEFLDRGESTSQRFMFSLRDGRLMHYGGYKAVNELEGEGVELRVPTGCTAKYGKIKSRNASHRTQ